MPRSSSAAADPAGAALVLSVGKPAASAATVASERLCTVEGPVAPVDLGGLPEVKVESTSTYDGLEIQRLSWQLPCGPRTEMVR